MGVRHIDKKKCLRCGLCVTICPQDVNTLSSPICRTVSPVFCAKSTARPKPSLSPQTGSDALYCPGKDAPLPVTKEQVAFRTQNREHPARST